MWGHDLLYMGIRTAHEAPEKTQMNERRTISTNGPISLEDVN
jgi:hypothetical protein